METPREILDLEPTASEITATLEDNIALVLGLFCVWICLSVGSPFWLQTIY